MLRLLITAWMALATPAFAGAPKDGSHNRFTDVTVRFDESSSADWLRLRLKSSEKFQALPEQLWHYVVYFGPNDLAYVWIPGQPIVFETTWEQVVLRVTNTDRFTGKRVVTTNMYICLDQFWTHGPLCRSVPQMEQTLAEAFTGDLLNLNSGLEPCRTCRAGDSVSTIQDVSRWE